MPIFSKTPTSTQTGTRLAELQALHLAAAERAEAARGNYVSLVEQVVTGEADQAAADKARAAHKYAADQAEALGDSVAAAQRRHDAALETEERARKAEQWRQVVELSGKRTEAAEAFHKTLTALAKQRAELARLGGEIAQLAPFRSDANGGSARLMRADLDSLVNVELYRTGVTRGPANDSLVGDLAVLVDVMRDADRWILSQRDEALRGA